MPRMPNVSDAEIIACHVSAEKFLYEMHDFISRIEKGYIDRIEHPDDSAREFALIAQAASTMAAKLLSIGALQKQKDEVAALHKSAELNLSR